MKGERGCAMITNHQLPFYYKFFRMNYEVNVFARLVTDFLK